ncbi:hypothetical protein AURDEDRAFT_113649 [Auricularia subglabra TFB-10046 SS5]|nr:hypothetical protein AURDEDRAFT_113649 [Auricularia subglabra TFB-10046 SS5]
MAKASKAKAYYAVVKKKEHTGLVFASWEDAEPSTKNVSGAQCKGCDTLSEVKAHFKKYGVDLASVQWRSGLEQQDLSEPAAPVVEPPLRTSLPVAHEPPVSCPSTAPSPSIPRIPTAAPSEDAEPSTRPAAAEAPDALWTLSAPPRILCADTMPTQPNPPTPSPLSGAASEPPPAGTPAPIPPAVATALHGLASAQCSADVLAVLNALAYAGAPAAPPTVADEGIRARLISTLRYIRNLIDGALLALGDTGV